jgi:hypothetical protein
MIEGIENVDVDKVMRRATRAARKQRKTAPHSQWDRIWREELHKALAEELKTCIPDPAARWIFAENVVRGMIADCRELGRKYVEARFPNGTQAH